MLSPSPAAGEKPVVLLSSILYNAIHLVMTASFPKSAASPTVVRNRTAQENVSFYSVLGRCIIYSFCSFYIQVCELSMKGLNSIVGFFVGENACFAVKLSKEMLFVKNCGENFRYRVELLSLKRLSFCV